MSEEKDPFKSLFEIFMFIAMGYGMLVLISIIAFVWLVVYIVNHIH